MPDTAALLAAVSEQHGAGNTLRLVPISSIVGAALLAWFLLRSYRENGSDDQNNDRVGVSVPERPAYDVREVSPLRFPSFESRPGPRLPIDRSC